MPRTQRRAAREAPGLGKPAYRAARKAPGLGKPVYIVEYLPEELQLHILQDLDDFNDCVAICLAWPPLGLYALRAGLKRFNDPLFAVAMRMATVRGFKIDEPLLRRYAGDERACEANLEWLKAMSPALHLCPEADAGSTMWRLSRPGGPIVRAHNATSGLIMHFEGEKRDAEGAVRAVCNDCETYFDGTVGIGRMTHQMSLDKLTTLYFAGPKGDERRVRWEGPSGMTIHFEGAKGLERITCTITCCDGQRTVNHYEGEKDVERLVRSSVIGSEQGDSMIWYFGGACGDERRVRAEQPDLGLVVHFEGPRHQEVMARVLYHLPAGETLRMDENALDSDRNLGDVLYAMVQKRGATDARFKRHFLRALRRVPILGAGLRARFYPGAK